MPIARTPALNLHWIPREAEDEFINLLNDKQARVLPLMGVGGAGKTSLLRRFSSHCQQHEIPALYLDLPRLLVASTLDVLLQLETSHTPAFEKQRKKLHTSYETLSALLQSYGGSASGAAELLQKSAGKDESFGLAVDAVVGIGKVAHLFLQREENRQHQALLQQPEESLLRALAEDFRVQGVILIDTLEQAGKQNLPTRLQFREDGEMETPTAETTRNISLLDYCAGMAHFLFDKPVLMVLAGRPPAIRELGGLSVEYFAPTVEVPAFTAAEIRTYLESSLPRHIASPQESDISTLQQLTHGNPFLLERVVRLLADWRPTWEWQAQQWQPLLDSYQRDERHGLLLYVTQRLLTHVLPDDRAFWRLALPRQYIHRDMAELLFPKDEFDEQSGLQRLRAYEDKGIIYREQDPDRYFLHDETRAAITAWAKREGVWLDKAASEIHARLAAWFDQQSGWQALQKTYSTWEKSVKANKPDIPPPEFGNPLLLEGAYHKLMADDGFEQRYQGYDRPQFWKLLSASLSLTNAEKMRGGAALPDLSLFQIQELTKTFENEIGDYGKLFKPATQRWMEEQSRNGRLPADWGSNEQFVREVCKRFPGEPGFVTMLCKFVSPHEQEQLYQQALDADPKDARNLGNFTVFMATIRKDSDHAEALYQQALDAEPSHARNLGSFAIFLHLYRKDYPQAKQLYLLEGDKTQGSALIIQAFATNPEAPALKLELWFYRLAHFPLDYPQAQAEVLALLETGARSEGWDFSGNIAQAERDGHGNIPLLQALADVITGKAELDSLPTT